MNEKTTILQLPSDAMFEILLRLPMIYLLRCKSVCKLWHAVCKDNDFIEAHRIRCAPHTSIFLSNFFYPINRYRLLHHNGSIGELIDFNFPEIDYYSVLNISNGLVCLYTRGVSGLVIIFNPATRQFRRIPNDKPLAQLLFASTGLESGFNYSLVRVFFPNTDGNDGSIVHSEMYNLSTCEWRNMNLKIREINARERSCIAGTNQMTHISLNGVFYWEVHIGDKSTVSCLDVCNETYDEITTPGSSLFNIREDCQKLINLKGEVTFILYGMQQNYWMELWVLNEERNWNKKFTIKDCPIISLFPRVVGCLGHNELMVRDFDSWKPKLYSYDVDNGERKTLFVENIGLYDDPFMYSESLLPV